MITFSDNIERKPYLGSTEIAEVWLGNIKIYPDNVEPPTPSGYENQYLTFEALADDTTFTFTPLNNNVVKYSLNNGRTWVEGNSVQVGNGNKVLVKGELIPLIDTNNNIYGIGTFSSSANFNVEGNIMSLLFGDNFTGKTDLTGYDYAFEDLFLHAYNMINAKNLVLPAKTLSKECYFSMFMNCYRLVTTPKLPATTLADSCYHHMFNNCESLVNAPELPATTLASRCYNGMFDGCTSLTTAPELPATTLADYCYYGMFSGCTSLVNAQSILPATTLADYCYEGMFMSCTSLTTAPELPAISLSSHCYWFMFDNCHSLNYIKAMFTTTPSKSYTDSWVYGVASTGTFVKNTAATWDVRDDYGIPTGWRVETASA